MRSKKIFTRIAFVALVLFLAAGAVRFGPGEDIDASVSGVSGDVVTVSVHNAGTESRSVRVQLTVALDNGSFEALTTAQIVLAPNDTVTLQALASRAILSILDGPDPIVI